MGDFAKTQIDTSPEPVTIAIALFNRVTMLNALDPYSVLCDLPNTEVTFVTEKAWPVTDSKGRLSVVAHAALPI
jgi:hypothetical protein